MKTNKSEPEWGEQAPLINRIYLQGRVERDPRVHYIAYDTPQVEFSLHTIEQVRRGRQDLSYEQKLWHRVVAYGDVAQRIEREVRSGMMLRLYGRISYVRNTDRDGYSQRVTEIECQDFITLAEPPKVEEVSRFVETPQPTLPEVDWSTYQETDEPF